MYCVRIRNSTKVRLYRRTPKAKQLVSLWPWVELETVERAAMFKKLAERDGVVPEWFYDAALGLSKRPRAPRNRKQMEML